MPSGSAGDRRLPPPPPAESTRCPRCDSNNTKFCYYNNYNLAQPRHFCKSCRRYWTLGGSLRNIPIGGSSRAKPSSSTSFSSKRRRATASSPVLASSTSSSSSSSPPLSSSAADSLSITPISVPPHVEPNADDPISAADVVGSFAALLTEPLPAGFLALGDPFLQGRGGCGGFGLGLGLAAPPGTVNEMGFGIGRAAWPFYGEEDGCCGSGGERDAWQLALGGGEAVVGGEGDCFGWPELAISTPGWQGLP